MQDWQPDTAEQDKQAYFLSALQDSLTDEARDIFDEERQKYSAHYGTLPGANSQQVSLPDAAEFLSKAKIKRELIEQILVKNTRGSGAVTLDAFVQSMHETYEALMNKLVVVSTKRCTQVEAGEAPKRNLMEV